MKKKNQYKIWKNFNVSTWIKKTHTHKQTNKQKKTYLYDQYIKQNIEYYKKVLYMYLNTK